MKFDNVYDNIKWIKICFIYGTVETGKIILEILIISFYNKVI